MPVCIDYAALQETVKYGMKVKGDIYDKETKEEYKKALITALKDDKWQKQQREAMMPWAKEKYSWSKIALQWNDDFKENQLEEAAGEVLKANPEAKNLLPVGLQKKLNIEPTY